MPVQILGVTEARDFIAGYFFEQYGIEQTEPWTEQNITPADAVGSSTIRFVSGPLTIVISAPAAAPSPPEYTIDEASFLTNGFFWEGTLKLDGDITESVVILPATVLSEEQARDAVLEFMSGTLSFPAFDEWTDGGISATENDTALRVFTSGAWEVEIEFAPAAPLISGYYVVIHSTAEGIRWEGDISLYGEIVEISFTK